MFADSYLASAIRNLNIAQLASLISFSFQDRGG